ncbi:hypothetical protein Tco_0969123 [Tanacetum coccineum]
MVGIEVKQSLFKLHLNTGGMSGDGFVFWVGEDLSMCPVKVWSCLREWPGQDKLPSSVELDFRARLDDGRMYSGHPEAKVEVKKLTTNRLVNGSSCDWVDMVIKDLDLEPKVDAMVRDFLD